jgi:hypothetical protein
VSENALDFARFAGCVFLGVVLVATLLCHLPDLFHREKKGR